MFGTKIATPIPEDELEELCQKTFDKWRWSDFMTFCQWKEIWKPGEPLDECYFEARELWRAMIGPLTSPKIKKESALILENLKRTTISIASSEFLDLRRRGRLDHLGGEGELEKFIAFNKSPVELEAVGFAKECVDYLTLRDTDDDSKSFSKEAKQGIAKKIRQLRKTAAGHMDVATSHTVSRELETLTRTCSEALTLASCKEEKGKRGDIHTVANLVNTIGVSFTSAADKWKYFSCDATFMVGSKGSRSTVSTDTASTILATSVPKLSVILEASPHNSVVL